MSNTTRPVLFTVEIIGPRGPVETHTLRARVDWDEKWGFDEEAAERAIDRAVRKARPGANRCWVPNLEISPDRYLVRDRSKAGESRCQYGHIGHLMGRRYGGGVSLDCYARITAKVL